MQLVLDFSVAQRLGTHCRKIQAAVRKACAVLVRQECGSLFQTAEQEILDCVMMNAHSRTTGLFERLFKRTHYSGSSRSMSVFCHLVMLIMHY